MELVLTVFGWEMMLDEKMPPAGLTFLATVAANRLPSADIHAPDHYWLVVVSAVHVAP